MFMGPCIVIILVYNSNWMHKSQSLFCLTTALRVSGVTISHLQEHKTTVTTASGNRYSVLLSAAIVEELELYTTITKHWNNKFYYTVGSFYEFYITVHGSMNTKSKIYILCNVMS
jgi:hypothetical protein